MGGEDSVADATVRNSSLSCVRGRGLIGRRTMSVKPQNIRRADTRKRMIIRTRNQVAVALTSAKKKTYLTRWLHDGCGPKLLPLIHTYSDQTMAIKEKKV